MDGVATTENERKSSENGSKNWAKVCCNHRVIPMLTRRVEKRAPAQKAETDFFALLREKSVAGEGLAWKDVRPFSYVDGKKIIRAGKIQAIRRSPLWGSRIILLARGVV